MRPLYFAASVPCTISGRVLSALGVSITYAGDVLFTLGWALRRRGSRQ